MLQRRWIIFGLCSAVGAVIYFFTASPLIRIPTGHVTMVHPSINSPEVRYKTRRPSETPPRERVGIKGSNSDIWSPSMDVLEEATVLKDNPLIDVREMADVKHSVYHIIDRKQSYQIGDEVKVVVQLYDGLGRRRTVGGDRLRVRIFERRQGAGANGYVIDHVNGSYSATVTCLWAGFPSIEIALDFPRQVIRVFYDQLRTNYRTMSVSYTNNERQPCQPTRELLNLSKPICNMADRNGGMSWFCQAPEMAGATCQDVKIFNHNTYSNPVTRQPDAKLIRVERALFPPIRIFVKGNTIGETKPHRKPACYLYNRTQLWFLAPPIGYFIRNQWTIRHCAAPPGEKLPGCVRNKHIVLFGDSTMVQWAEYLQESFELNTTTPAVTVDGVKFKSDSFSYNSRLNLTVEMIRHSLPGNPSRNISHSIAKYILNYLAKDNMVFVVHIYAHVITHHYSIWRDRIRHIRQSIELFLQHNSGAMFLIKGGNGVHPLRLYRYAEYLYRRILIEEFEGLYNNVIYLDSADATAASGAVDIHPNAYHVKGMVDQMLAYVCH